MLLLTYTGVEEFNRTAFGSFDMFDITNYA